MKFSDKLTMDQARKKFFEETGFSETDYEARLFKLKFGPLSLYFPNTLERAKAVKLHDLHHILTGYDTSWTGEAEISAWELGSGCKDYFAAWYYSLIGFSMGLIISRERTLKAFLRGRRTKNLYGRTLNEDLLNKSIGELKEELFLKYSEK